MGKNNSRLYMVCALWLVCASSSWAQASKGVAWTTDYQAGLEVSVKEQKPMLVDFYADWCGPCKMMDAQVYSDPAVIKALKEFVTVKINVDVDERTAYAYRIKSIPRTVVLNVHGEIIGDMVGFMDVEEFLKFLKDVKVDALKKIDGIKIIVSDAPPGNEEDEERVSNTTKIEELLELTFAQDAAVRKEAQTEVLTRDAKTVAESIDALLRSDYLGARLAGYRLLSNKSPGAAKGFDPWGTRTERATMLEQLSTK